MKLSTCARGRLRTGRGRNLGISATVVGLAAVAMSAGFAVPAHGAGAYVFTKVVDSAADNFNPQTLRVSCPSINTRGDIAFKSDQGAAEDGIYRADAAGGLTTITEVAPGSGALLANGNPSMNDSGEVSFGATSPDGVRTIRRGDGTTLTTIASTQGTQFVSFGDSTSINDANGEVAFDAGLSSGTRGLFSGSGGDTTTHYLDTEDAIVDASPARFTATEDRPSINDLGDIAFLDEIQNTFQQNIFSGQAKEFTTISASDPPSAETPPLLNDGGIVVWQTSFPDGSGFSTRAIVTGDGAGPATRVVDSSGAFDLFHSYALNNTGAVAFSATLDSDPLGIPAIYVGPRPKKDRVIGPGDKLDGGTVAGLRFCEEGLNDSGELAFVAEIADRNGDVRVGVFRATLRR